MSNLVQRTLSGAVYVALVVAGILVHPAFFGALFLVVSCLAVREFGVLMHSSRFDVVSSVVCGALLFLTAWIGFHGASVGIPVLCWRYIGLLWLLCVIITLVMQLFLKESDPIHNWGIFLQSQLMIALPFALMNYLLAVSPYMLLALFILIWLNDSGAYCVGSLLSKRKGGNHKMFPRVSPGKSWEGLIGGAVVAIIMTFVLDYVGWLGCLLTPQTSLLLLLSGQSVLAYHIVIITLFALVVVASATLGDLMESLMKRTIGVKDSGRFMPGHGGVLDRFDSMLLATPVVALFLLFFI